MKNARRRTLSGLGALASWSALAAVPVVRAQQAAAAPAAATPASAAASAASATASAPAEPALPHFAVEIRTGPGWDTRRPPQEQALFREHSAHLRRLREEGHVMLGARYADKGLLVVAAADTAAVRALFDADPSMKAGTFVYELHPLSVFYGGCVQPARRRGG